MGDALQEDRGEHRRQREGDEERNQHRKDDGQRKLEEESADDPLHEGNGEKDRHNGEGRRHDGQTDLGGGEGRCLPRRHPIFHVTVDVLDDDDRVVDEQAHRKGKRKHRHVVEGEAEGADQREGGDDRHRQGDRADQCRPEVSEEDEYGQNREEAPEDQMLLHLIDGAPDEGGLVHRDVQAHPRREGLSDLLDLCFDEVDDGDGVGPGLLLHPHGDRRDAVVTDHGALLLHPVFGFPDIPETYGSAPVVGDDQVVDF